jgi:hypothetical protein
MTATHVIEEIKHLPHAEQSRVIQFAFEPASECQLPGKKLSELAQRMADSDDPAEVEKLKAEITRGFYGEWSCRASAATIFHRNFWRTGLIVSVVATFPPINLDFWPTGSLPNPKCRKENGSRNFPA